VNGSDQIGDDFRELIEAYALDALDREERAAVAAHLATGCAGCTAALGEAQWLVSQLAYLAPEATPSDMLRGRLLKTVREEAAASKPSPSAPPKSAIPVWMWGAVAAMLLFALYNAYELRVTTTTIEQTRAELEKQIRIQRESARELAIARREALILTDPKSMKIAMPAASKDLPVMQAMWNPELGLFVSGQKLPVLPGNRTLQLWLIPKAAGAKPVPSLTLRPSQDGKFDLLVANPPDSPSDTKALAITEEPDGGSRQPTTTPIWVGAVAGK
jgi:Anti-sigma-K factor rskA/Putative zinc-finger